MTTPPHNAVGIPVNADFFSLSPFLTTKTVKSTFRFVASTLAKFPEKCLPFLQKGKKGIGQP